VGPKKVAGITFLLNRIRILPFKLRSYLFTWLKETFF